MQFDPFLLRQSGASMPRRLRGAAPVSAALSIRPTFYNVFGGVVAESARSRRGVRAIRPSLATQHARHDSATTPRRLCGAAARYPLRHPSVPCFARCSTASRAASWLPKRQKNRQPKGAGDNFRTDNLRSLFQRRRDVELKVAAQLGSRRMRLLGTSVSAGSSGGPDRRKY